MKRLRILLVHARSAANLTLSYQRGWPRHFARHPGFEVSFLNTRAARPLALARARWLGLVRRFDAVVLLHSVFSNACALDGRLLDAVRALPAPKVFFVGNEYKLMPEKLAFATCDAPIASKTVDALPPPISLNACSHWRKCMKSAFLPSAMPK